MKFQKRMLHHVCEQELISILDSWYPIELPSENSIRLQVLTWLNYVGIVKGEEKLALLEKKGTHCFASRLFPLAEPADLRLVSKLFALLFIMDDLADEMQDANFWSIVKRSEPVDGSGNHDFLGTVHKLIFSSNWGVGDCFELYFAVLRFVETGVQEQVYRKRKLVPDRKYYWSVKSESSGVQIAQTLLRLMMKVSFDGQYQDCFPLLQHLAAKIIILENDILSYRKESLLGDAFNMVHIRMHRFGEDESTAVQYVRNRIKGLKSRFARTCLAHFPLLPLECFAPDAFVNGMLSQHQDWHSLACLWCMVKGSQTWAQLDTDRYSSCC